MIFKILHKQKEFLNLTLINVYISIKILLWRTGRS